MGEGKRAREAIPQFPTKTQLAQKAKISEAGANSWEWSWMFLEAPWLREGVYVLIPEGGPEPWIGMCVGMWLAGAGVMAHPLCSKDTPSQEKGLGGLDA